VTGIDSPITRRAVPSVLSRVLAFLHSRELAASGVQTRVCVSLGIFFRILITAEGGGKHAAMPQSVSDLLLCPLELYRIVGVRK